LCLPSSGAVSDLEGANIDAALRGLKAAMSELADDVRGTSNVDRRFVEYLDGLVAKLPVEVPPQEELFSIAHNEDVLNGYLTVANKEWEQIQASKLGALALQFERTMEKFPEWRAFKKKPVPDDFTVEQAEEAKTLSEALKEHLADELAREFANPKLPLAVEQLALQLDDGEPRSSSNYRELTLALNSRAQDLLESSSNILKRIVEAGMNVLGKGYEIVKSTGEVVVKGAAEQNEKEAKKFGQSIVKWLYRSATLAIAGGAAAGSGLLGWAATTFPNIFGWLEKFIPFFV